MKEIEKIEASIYLYDCLKEILSNKAVDFMKKLKDKFNVSQILDFDEDEIREIYTDKDACPGIYLKFKEKEIEDKKYYFTLKIEIGIEEICLCFGFDSKKKGEEISFVKLEDMKNISKDFYDNLANLENKLKENNITPGSGKKAIDMSIENTNFRKVSLDNEFLINLLEEKTLNKEVERVYKEITGILDKAGLK